MTSSSGLRRSAWLAGGLLLVGIAWWFAAATLDAAPPQPADAALDHRPAAAVGADAQPIDADATAPSRTSQPNPKTVVRVLERATETPLADARVLLLGRWGTALGERTTDANGEVILPTKPPKLYGVVARHDRFMLGGARVRGSETVLRLQPRPRLKVAVVPTHGVTEELLMSCDKTLEIRYSQNPNPLKAHHRFLATKALSHWDLRRQFHPMHSLEIEVALWIDDPGKLEFRCGRTQDDRIVFGKLNDGFGRGRSAAPDRQGSTLTVSVQSAFRPGDPLVRIPIRHSRHALIAHYSPPPGKRDRIVLHLAPAPKHTPRSKITIEQNNMLTFMAFDLRPGLHRPTLVINRGDGSLHTLDCAPVAVEGRTEVHLQPRPATGLVVRLKSLHQPATRRSKALAQASSPVLPATEKFSIPGIDIDVPTQKQVFTEPDAPTVLLFQPDLTPLQLTPIVAAEGTRMVYPALTRGTYLVLARAPGQVSRLRRVHISTPGKLQVELVMHPVCHVTLRMDGVHRYRWRTLEICDAGSGLTRLLRRTSGQFQVFDRRGETSRANARHYLLDLPPGRYTFVGRTGELRWRKVVDVAGNHVEVRVGE